MVGKGFIAKLWHWFDDNFLLVASAFLIVFIPLYPKIPLGDIIPGYIVRLRLEDIFIGLVALWFFFQLLRRRISWKTPLTWCILAYLVTGLLSNILGVVLTRTIPASVLHFGKSTLHWLRHIEYFSLFFVSYAAVKNKTQAFMLLAVSAITGIAVVVYGYGQKFLYWPVYSTMNREFSKGERLYLSEFARVQSTFAGHYDLGAYLVVMLPAFLAFFFVTHELLRAGTFAGWKKRGMQALRWVFFLAWLGGLWLLALSASRTSFLAYGGALVIMMGVLTLKRGFKWGITRGFSVVFVSVVMMLVVGELPSRFAQLIDQNQHPQLHAAFHTVNDIAQHPLKLIGYSYQAAAPKGGIAVGDVENTLNQQGMTVSDTQPSTTRPSDVYTDVPEKVFQPGDPAATLAGNLVNKNGQLVQQRVFSDCALRQSLSLCIRFETLWPMAIQGFERNILFGSGYATLNKTSVGEFTEAESTDNNFLRTLGENGLLGFIFFYGLDGLAIWYSWLAFRKSDDPIVRALAASIIAGTIGLLVNATYIDVFVASKVAEVFWLFQGIALAVYVREGLVTPQYAFERIARANDTKNLASLLKQVEAKTAAKSNTESPYLSSHKKRLKSSKKKHQAVGRR